jgi:hypothetical protein
MTKEEIVDFLDWMNKVSMETPMRLEADYDDVAMMYLSQCETKIEVYLIPTFDQFWDLYDKKIDPGKCKKKWLKLKQSEKEGIMEYIPKYIAVEPNKKYRRNPETFLNNRSWENEIIMPEASGSKTENTIEIFTKLRQENGNKN